MLPKSILLLLLLDAAASAQSSGTFSPTQGMAAPRTWHTATLLTNGQVLIASGEVSLEEAGFDTLATADLNNPDSGTFTPTDNMTTARFYHTATLLPSGRVLIAGGASGKTVPAALNSA
jgi:hypothetical protein